MCGDQVSLSKFNNEQIKLCRELHEEERASLTFISASHPFQIISKGRLPTNQVREYTHLQRGELRLAVNQSLKIELMYNPSTADKTAAP